MKIFAIYHINCNWTKVSSHIEARQYFVCEYLYDIYRIISSNIETKYFIGTL